MKNTCLSSLFLILFCLFTTSCTDDLDGHKSANEINESRNINDLIEYAKSQYSNKNLKSATHHEPDWEDYNIIKESQDTLLLSIPISLDSDGRQSLLVINQIEANKQLFLVNLPDHSNDTLPLNIRRRILVYQDGTPTLCRPVYDQNGQLRIAKLRTSPVLKQGGFDGGALPEVIVYGSNYDIFWWWWDYIAGIMQLPPPLGVPGGNASNPSDNIADYYKVENIKKDDGVKKVIEDMKTKLKTDTSPEKGRRELGVWVFYDEETKKYYVGNIKEGQYTKGGEGTNASIAPGNATPAKNGSHIPSTAKPVTFIHIHTPLTNEKDCQRQVGFSQSDITYANANNIEIIVVDYVGTLAPDGIYYIYGGHDINDPMQDYYYIPKK